MKYKHLIIEKKEYVLLKRLINLSKYSKEEKQGKSFGKFSDDLERAQIYDEEKVPYDIVRINSVVQINLKTDGLKKIQLVMPSESDLKKEKVSVLSALGMGLIGRAEGEALCLKTPSGKVFLTVEKVVQNQKPIDLAMVL